MDFPTITFDVFFLLFRVNISSFGCLGMTLIHCVMNDIRVTERQPDPEKLKTRSLFFSCFTWHKLNGEERFKGCQSNGGMDDIIYCNRERWLGKICFMNLSRTSEKLI